MLGLFIKLQKRLQQHTQAASSIFKHFKNDHNCIPNKEMIFENTKIIAKAPNRYKLFIKEALLISHKNPSINKQFETFIHTLKLHPHRNINATLRTTDSNNNAPVSPPRSNTPLIRTQEDRSPNDNLSGQVIRHNVSPVISRQINRLLTESRNSNQINNITRNHISLRTRIIERNVTPPTTHSLT